MLPAIFIFLVLVGLDQWLKIWSVAHLYSNVYLDVIPKTLAMILVSNTAGVWLFAGAPVFGGIVKLLVGLGILVHLWKKRPSGLFFWSAVVLAAGLVGNGIDGIWRAEVVEMLYSDHLSWMSRKIFKTPFPVFNLADVCAVVGAFLLVVANLFTQKPRTFQQHQA